MTDVQENEEGFRALGEVVDVDDNTHEVVVEFPHEVIDGHRTDWGQDCFRESFERQLPPMLVNHNPDHLIGRAVKAESLGSRSRLVGKFSDFDAVPKAREAYANIRDKITPGWSFHFRNARSIPHPNVRSARRFTKADMLEFSPVTFPSIPGANAIGLRSEDMITVQGATLMQVPDLDTILKLQRDGYIDEEGVRALLSEHYPMLREHITLSSIPVLTPREQIDDYLTENAPELVESFRSLEVTPEDAPEDAQVLIRAIDDALDQASVTLGDMDLRSLPDPVQQALALTQAAGVAVDELQEVMGIEDTGTRTMQVSEAPWEFDASKYTPEQLRSACLVIDGDGSTQADCHLPVKEPDGTLNKNAVHAAAAALDGARGGTKLSDPDKKSAADALVGLYAKIGEKAPDGVTKLASGSRSDDGVARAMETLNRRVA